MNPNLCFNVQIVNNGSSCLSPRISDQSSAIHSSSLHTDNKLLKNIEILIYFIFNMIEWDQSTWLTRRKVDRSIPQSVQTLTIDQPLFWALATLFEPPAFLFNKCILVFHVKNDYCALEKSCKWQSAIGNDQLKIALVHTQSNPKDCHFVTF